MKRHESGYWYQFLLPRRITIYEDATDEEIKERINNTTQYKAIRVYCK